MIFETFSKSLPKVREKLRKDTLNATQRFHFRGRRLLFEGFWLLLAPVAFYWLLLAPVGSYWLLLAPIGSSSLLVVPIGPSWLPLAPIGCFWLPLAPGGSY